MEMNSIAQPVDVLSVASFSARQQRKSASVETAAVAAKDFESVFMSQMLKPMWEGVETDSMFGGGAGEDVMKDLLIQEYGKSMATADNYGLAQNVMEAMIRLQETADRGGNAQGGNA